MSLEGRSTIWNDSFPDAKLREENIKNFFDVNSSRYSTNTVDGLSEFFTNNIWSEFLTIYRKDFQVRKTLNQFDSVSCLRDNWTFRNTSSLSIFFIQLQSYFYLTNS